MLLNPRYGRVGLLAFPYYFFLEMLGPMVELLGYLSFAITLFSGHATWPYSLAFLGVSVFLGGALTLAAIVESEMSSRRYQRPSDLARLFGLALVENLGYRQLTLWWRLKGTISALRGVEAWGESVRKGFGPGEEPSAG